MSFEVYDYRTVNRNVLITPEIRARLYHMAPGQVDGRHSHDLGHEVFLILEGQAEFTIGSGTRVLGPGELCIALADEIHQVRNLLPDRPTIMYLSVTPHIHPTHTGRDATDAKLPPRFQANTNYHAPQDLSIPEAKLLAEHLAALAAVVQAAQGALTVHQAQAQILSAAWAAGDVAAAGDARVRMWDALYPLFRSVYALGDAWNQLAPRATPQNK
jgi:quercetin dioxygenase-like cupin family protein